MGSLSPSSRRSSLRPTRTERMPSANDRTIWNSVCGAASRHSRTGAPPGPNCRPDASRSASPDYLLMMCLGRRGSRPRVSDASAHSFAEIARGTRSHLTNGVPTRHENTNNQKVFFFVLRGFVIVRFMRHVCYSTCLSCFECYSHQLRRRFSVATTRRPRGTSARWVVSGAAGR